MGSGSLIIVALLALYPMLRPNDLVGTDLVQAVPLVTAAAIGHLLFGDFQFDVTTTLLHASNTQVVVVVAGAVAVGALAWFALRQEAVRKIVVRS